MSYAKLLENLGFDSDPFAKTNADEEERLEEYFIPPPFFSAVYGDINTPKSSIVFAPRGNGKTALKRKIELSSKDEDILCIAYNTFNITGKKLTDIDQAYHLNNIVRLVVIAVITATQDGRLDNLEKDDRHLVYLFTKEYLSELDRTELKNGIDAIKNFSDKAKEFWNKFTGPVGIVINALLTKIGLGESEIKGFETQSGKLGSHIDQLQSLIKIAEKLNYKCIYILVDRIDENSLTNVASNSYKFIAPVVSDLQLLELNGYAFKLFLWDKLLDEYRSVERPDRVKYYKLKWEQDQLCNMLSKRLRAYSQDRVSSLNQLLEDIDAFDLDKFISYFAQGSPRNVIRICKEIFDNQAEIDVDSRKLDSYAVQLGFEKISEDMSRERYTETLVKELKKTKRCDFTIRHVSTNVFKFSHQAGKGKVKGWQDAGAVKLLGTVQETEGARSSNHYGISDLMLAKTAFSDLSIFEFANTKLMICTCDELLVRDWDLSSEQVCEHCQTEVIKTTQ